MEMQKDKSERFIQKIEVNYLIPVFVRKCLKEVKVVLDSDHKIVVEFLKIGHGSIELNLMRQVGGGYVIRDVVLDGVPIINFEANRNMNVTSRDKAFFVIYGEHCSVTVHALMPYLLSQKVYGLEELRKMVSRLLGDTDMVDHGRFEVEVTDFFNVFKTEPFMLVSKRNGITDDAKAHGYRIGGFEFNFRRAITCRQEERWNVELLYNGLEIDEKVVENVVIKTAGEVNHEKVIEDFQKLCKILELDVGNVKESEVIDFIVRQMKYGRLYNYDEAMMLLNRAEMVCK